MVMSDRMILDGIQDGSVVVHPFNAPDLGSASFDVRLGRYYYRATRPDPNDTRPQFYNIHSQHRTNFIWGRPRTAIRALDLMMAYDSEDWDNIHDDDEVIILHPHDNLLCHTYEFIGARRDATTMMKARSSIGRSLVNVCQCAGMGDVGFFNRWTMEIHNRSGWHIPLVVHRRVAQIVFMPTGPTDKLYLSKYQGSSSLDDLECYWNPSMMLPRLDLDRDIVDRFVAVEY